MKSKKCCKVGAYGTLISGLCCLGVVGALIALFGATAAVAYVNKFGDFIFLPAFGLFGTLLVYGMLSLRRNWLTYSLTAIVAAFGLYFSLSLFGILLTLAGIVIGAVIIWILRRV